MLANNIIIKGERYRLGGGGWSGVGGNMEDIMEGLIKDLRYIWETSEKESTKEMETEVEEDNRDCGINMTDL